MIESGVYKITNIINNKNYIGCSSNIEKRWKAHKILYKNTDNESCFNKILYMAMRKYGIENFTFSIIEKTDNYFEREKYWISFYNSFGPNGYNMTAGGEGRFGTGKFIENENNPNAKLTNKEVEFLRECILQDFNQQEIYSEYFENKISFYQFQKIWQGQNWKNINIDAVNYIHSKEYISKIRSKASLSRQIVKDNNDRLIILKQLYDNQYSRLEAYEYYIKNYESTYSLNSFTHLWYKIKPQMEKQFIYKIDLDTNIILDKYISFAEAGRANNCDPSGISKVCKKLRKSCGGYKWEQK